MLTPTGITLADYLNAIKSDAPKHVRLNFFSQGIILDDRDINITTGLSVQDILNGETDLTFGKAVMKQMTTTIINSDRVSGLLWTDTFNLDFGVEIDGETKWVTFGVFRGQQPKNVTSVENIPYTAYDLMQLFDIEVDSFWESLVFPTTVGDIFHGMCDFVGLPYNDGDAVPNMLAREFTEAPANMQGYLLRDILAWIAEACGCYAKMNASGEAELVWYRDHTDDVTIVQDDQFRIETADQHMGMVWDDFDLFTWDEAEQYSWDAICGYAEAYSVDSIMVRSMDDQTDVFYPMKMDGNVYQIVGNPFLDVARKAEISVYIAPLYDRLKEFGGHLPLSLDCTGNWLIESGDVIKVEVTDGVFIDVPVFCRTIRWNGACDDLIEVTGNVVRSKIASGARTKILERNSIRLFAKNSCYERQSGITIDPDGITVSGDRFVRIESGGVFDVDSTNFKLFSQSGVMISGPWRFDGVGMSYMKTDEESGDTSYEFEISELGTARSNTSGIYYHQIISSGEKEYTAGQIVFRVANKNEENNLTAVFRIGSQYVDGKWTKYIIPDITDGFDNILLGSYQNPFTYLGVKRIASSVVDGSYVGTSSLPFESGYFANLFADTLGSSTKNVSIHGALIHDYKSVTDLNLLTTPGNYWLSLSGVAHIPSDLSMGAAQFEVSTISTTIIRQRLYTGEAIYMRQRVNGTWYSWYKFTGTAV